MPENKTIYNNVTLYNYKNITRYNNVTRYNYVNITKYNYINISDYFYDNNMIESICFEGQSKYYNSISPVTNEAWTRKSWELGCKQYNLGITTLNQCKSKCNCNKAPTSFSNHVQYRQCSKTQASTNYITCRQNSCSGGNCCARSTNICKNACKTYHTIKFSGDIITYKDVDVIRYNNVTRYNNITRYNDVIRYNNVTRYNNITRYNDVIRYNNITRYNNETQYTNVIRYNDVTLYNYKNITRYIDKIRYINNTICTNDNINKMLMIGFFVNLGIIFCIIIMFILRCCNIENE